MIKHLCKAVMQLFSVLICMLLTISALPQNVSAEMMYSYEQNFDNFTFTPKTEFNDQTARWTMNFTENNNGSKVEVTDGGELALKSGVIPSTNLATIRFVPKRDTTKPLTGTVEIEFDIRLEGNAEDLSGMYTDYYFLSIQEQTNKDIGYLTFYGDELFLGKPAESCLESDSQKVNAIVAENLFDDADGKTIKVVIDFDEKTYTAFADGEQAKYYPAAAWDAERSGEYSGTATKKLLLDTATSLGRMIFGLSFKGYNSSASTEGIVNYMDNLKVTQYVKPTYKTNVASGQEGISVYDSFRFFFSEEMDAGSLDGIKLYEGTNIDGNEILVKRNSLADNGYSLTPELPLAYNTDYTLHIPNSVKSSTYGNVKGESITFTTQHATDEYYVYESFDGISSDPADYLAEKFNAVVSKSSDSINLFADSDELALSSDNNEENYFKMQFAEADTGVVTVKFDAEIPEGYVGKLFEMNDGESGVTASSNGETLTFGTETKDGVLKSGIHHFEFNFDFTGETPKAHIDVDNGKWKTSTDYAGSNFNAIDLYSGKNNGVIYIDNLLIYKKQLPTFVCNVNDGDAEANPDEMIVLSFNTPISENSIEKIKLYENNVFMETPEYTLSDDGKTLKFTEPMKYSMPYRIVIGEGLIADNGLALQSETISFYAMHKPTDVKIDTISVADSAGNAITNLGEFESIKATVSYQNVSSENADATLIIVFYRNGEMENIECRKIAILKGETSSKEFVIELPDNKEGLSVRIFGWDSYSKMNSLIPAITISE